MFSREGAETLKKIFQNEFLLERDKCNLKILRIKLLR